MPTIFKHHGNTLILVALQSSGAMPTALTLWTGSAGNCIKFTSLVKGKTNAPINAETTEYKTNDDSPYAITEDRTAKITGNLYDRSKLVSTWFETAVPTFKAAGRKFLAIYNLGIVNAEHAEVYMVCDMPSATSEPDGQPEEFMPIDITSTPPTSALALTTTQLAAINAAVGSGSVKGAAATKTIPAAPTPRLKAFTAVA